MDKNSIRLKRKFLKAWIFPDRRLPCGIQRLFLPGSPDQEKNLFSVASVVIFFRGVTINRRKPIPYCKEMRHPVRYTHSLFVPESSRFHFFPQKAASAA